MAERTNLNPENNPSKYIWASAVLFVLAVGGVFWLTQNKKTSIPSTPTKELAAEPTKSAVATVTNTASGSAVATVTPAVKTIESFESVDDGFRVKYSGLRKLYQDKENSGNRYTFYNNQGNITVHVGKSWSWINPGRTFTDELLVGGKESFIYEISNQKIVDVENNGKKYTIQCVHNGLKELKSECQKFLEDFGFI